MYQLKTDQLGEWEPIIAPFLEPIQESLFKETGTIFPPASKVFAPLELVQPSVVRVIILGQDPYPRSGQADGLAFSTGANALPSSLRNMQKEIICTFPDAVFTGTGNLTPWCGQGVLLINTTFTVMDGKPLSHAKLGWSKCVDAIIEHIESLPQPCTYLLFGRHAQQFAPAQTMNTVVNAIHPSGQSCWRGFIGSNCFQEVSSSVTGKHIDWSF